MPSFDLVLGDLIAEVTDIIGGTSSSRFSAAFFGRAATTACQQLSMDADHPYGELQFDLSNGTRRYQLPAISRILRVYIVGPDGSMSLCVPTDIPTLNGEIQETFDNTSGTRLGAPPQTPAWLVEPAIAYPDTNTSLGGRLPLKSQWCHNDRPSYALFGGWIEFTIPALTTSPLTYALVQFVAQHPKVSNPNDPILFPQAFKMALVNYMAARCYYSDNLDKSAELMAAYKAEATRANIAMERMQGGKTNGLVPVTRRRQRRSGGWFI